MKRTARLGSPILIRLSFLAGLAALIFVPGCKSQCGYVDLPGANDLNRARENNTEAAANKQTLDLPGITINRDAGTLELDAVVVGRHADWLELVACTPGSREHEALVTVSAKPSDLHLALLLLGVAPGQPQRGQRTPDGFSILPATGGPVALDFVVPAHGEQPGRVVPAGAWVLNLRTGQPLDTRRWMFTGSRFIKPPDTPADAPPEYLADLNGTVASLVHFGDETLGMDTTATQDTDGQNLAPNPDAMPPDGTAVILRITAVNPETAPKPDAH